MAVHRNEPQDPAPRRNWLDATLRRFNLLEMLRERNQIRRTCLDALKIYRQVESEMPQASKGDIYARVVERYSGAGPDEVREILRHAEDSFAAWPVERPLTFRDVVAYLAVTGCLKADPAVIGVRSRVFDLVSGVIRPNL